MPEISEAEYWQLVQSTPPARRSLDDLLHKSTGVEGLPKLVSRDRVIEPEPMKPSPKIENLLQVSIHRHERQARA